MPPLRRLDTAGDAVRQVIRAYHASPYDFDQFRALHIGKGEGAQSFGHGLYFSGGRDTHEFYKGNLGRHDPQIDPLWKQYTDMRDGIVDATKDERDELLWRIQDLRGIAAKRPAWTYEVEIGHPEDALLDLDAPVSAQPESVRSALRDVPGEPMKSGSRFGGNSTVVQDRRGWWLQVDGGGRFALSDADLQRMAGESGTGSQVYQRLTNALGGDYRASAELLNRGIPGAKYFDAGSRRVGDGTRNYVIFPGAEDQIRILRKYGLMAPMAAGAMSEDENR